MIESGSFMNHLYKWVKERPKPSKNFHTCSAYFLPMDIYTLSRNFWDYAFENPEVIKPNHAALYFFSIEHCNRLGWKEKFGLPTTMVMEAIGIRSYNTYINTLNDLVEFGLIQMVQRSKNQYSANIVALSNFDKANDKALDKALIKHSTKHITKHSESTSESISSIDIPIYNNTNKPINKFTILQYADDFNFFWDVYSKKVDRTKCEKAWNKLSIQDIKEIINSVSQYVIAHPDIQFRKNPLTYLNGKCWKDEIIIAQPKVSKLSGEMQRLKNVHDNLTEQIENGTFTNPFKF